MPLNPRQIEFCEQYMIDRNGTQAVIRAGFSEKGANVTAVRLLANPTVQDYIAERTQKHLERLEIDQATALRMYAALCLYDTRKTLNRNGSVKPISEWGDAEAYALTSFEVEEVTKTTGKKTTTTYKTSKLRFSDRKGALDSVAKMGGYEAPKGPSGPSTGELTVPFDMSKYTDAELAILAKGFKP